MGKFKKSIFILVLIISILSWAWPKTLESQENASSIEFNDMTLWVYPEYDDPRLLIMMQGKISGATVPLEVRFLVPSAAEMYSAGSMDDKGVYSGGPPQRQTSEISGWDQISYLLNTNTFRVEYYDPVIFGYPEKKISYDFRSLYTINNLKVVVQVPARSSEFTVSPPGNKNVENGFTVYTYNYSQFEVGQVTHFDISYTKTDNNPSLSSETPTASTTESNNPMLITLVFGFLIIAIVVLWLILRAKKRKLTKRYPSKKGQDKETRANSMKTFYCNQCGHPIKIQAKFCPNCGHKLGK